MVARDEVCLMIYMGYIGSVVLANLFVAKFGPNASILSAFALIGATLTLRDRIHEDMARTGRLWRMGVLILIAGLISAAFSWAAARIALASMIAFIVSEGVDALVYHRLRPRPWMVKANGSNSVSAAVDSILFPTLAFGSLLPLVVLGQFLAKTLGGAVWSWALKRLRFAPLVLLLIPGMAEAQIVSLNGAWIKNDVLNATAGEVFVSSPEFLKVRAYSIVSWNTDAGATPTVLVRVGHLHQWKWGALGVGAGVIRVPNDQFRPSFSVIGFGPGRAVRPYFIAAYEQPFGQWDLTTFVGVNWTVWFRR
jgi:hypothetical protein